MTAGLRHLPDEYIRRNLLYRDEATVTAKGLKFKGLHYYSEYASQHKWYERARSKRHGSWRIPILFDPSDTSKLYRVHDSETLPEECLLLEQSGNEPYRGLDWSEVEQEREIQKVNIQREKADKETDANATFNAKVDAIIADATDPELDKELRKASKRSQLTNIRSNRQEELADETQGNAPLPDINEERVEPLIGSADNKDEFAQYIPPAMYTDILDDEADEDE